MDREVLVFDKKARPKWIARAKWRVRILVVVVCTFKDLACVWGPCLGAPDLVSGSRVLNRQRPPSQPMVRPRLREITAGSNNPAVPRLA